MKKFRKALKKMGIHDRLVESIRETEKKFKTCDVNRGTTGTKMILKIEMMAHPDLADIFLEEATEKALEYVACDLINEARAGIPEDTEDTEEKEEPDDADEEVIKTLNHLMNLLFGDDDSDEDTEN